MGVEDRLGKGEPGLKFKKLIVYVQNVQGGVLPLSGTQNWCWAGTLIKGRKLALLGFAAFPSSQLSFAAPGNSCIKQ